MKNSKLIIRKKVVYKPATKNVIKEHIKLFDTVTVTISTGTFTNEM